VARIVSPLTRSWVSFSSKLTSAARSQVHTLVDFPKVRGLWCKTSLSRSACLAPKAAWVLCGRRDPGLSASKPRRLKALITSRTVSSEQPTLWAIAMACSPPALARIIWQRRSSKPSDVSHFAYFHARGMALVRLTLEVYTEAPCYKTHEPTRFPSRTSCRSRNHPGIHRLFDVCTWAPRRAWF